MPPLPGGWLVYPCLVQGFPTHDEHATSGRFGKKQGDQQWIWQAREGRTRDQQPKQWQIGQGGESRTTDQAGGGRLE